MFSGSSSLLVTDSTLQLYQCIERYKLESEISEEMITVCKPDTDTPSIYQLIEEKEKDLVLAAELGKALLDKNEEISQRREMITLDYTQKLEVTTAIPSDILLLNRKQSADSYLID